MKRKLPWMLFSIFILTACAANTDQAAENETPKVVEVDIQLPDSLTLNQENIFRAEVTQGNEAVEDADEVVFEIWKADEKEKVEKIEAVHEKNGIYSAAKSFIEDGVYFIQTHVTARDMHVMPKQQFVIGEVSEEEIKAAEEAAEQEKGNTGQHH
ncbi:FixH family protein [Bacillus sp. UMB0893]|uniref:FixH family protein n=1 Tax=Bacillus sp. UMB0893 TaxID=2066053 RepID=UPI000C765B03|nr:FixH family protein [Bacillus sp. UMB0893]PLR67553.1 hypothetical protein CYJ36_12935 [Bacillus sp. UMB0893]